MPGIATLPAWEADTVDDEWFTVEQIAKRLQVAERTVRRWLTEGELKGANFGGKAGWRIRRSDLDAFIAHRFDKKADPEPI